MIRQGATYTTRYVPVVEISFDPTLHCDPVDAGMVEHFRRLRSENPDMDFHPVYLIVRDGRLLVYDGRHRCLAAIMDNEPAILATVIEEPDGGE